MTAFGAAHWISAGYIPQQWDIVTRYGKVIPVMKIRVC